MKLKELRQLPFKAWDEIKTYDSIIVIPSGKKHESGWALMYIIGLDSKMQPIEIAASCDDIVWIFKASRVFSTDMFYKNGAIHFWGHNIVFEVGHSLSSTNVTTLNSNKHE